MWYEDARVAAGETMSQLALDYAYKASDWNRIWSDPRNASLVGLRKRPESLQPGDLVRVPIPWTMVTRALTPVPFGVQMEARRNGERGRRLSWVQTVFQDNQPVPGTTVFGVDGLPADDPLPFYFTDAELAGNPEFRRLFRDLPQRPPPSAALGATHWRAIVSLAVVTQQRVTVWDSTVWGFNITPTGATTPYGPRPATHHEVVGHLHLLRIGRGTGPLPFSTMGWTFRAAH